MADVQIDNGHFTQLANVLLEKVSSAKLNGCQHAIILQVWRYTYGFKRKEHELSAGFLAKATGYNQRQIQRDLIVLVDRNIIIQRVINGISRTLSFNKDFDKWDTTYGELADGEKADGQLTDGESAVPPTANKTGVTYGELADQEIKSFKQNLKQNTTTDFDKVRIAYNDIHKVIDMPMQDSPMLSKLLQDGITPELIIDVMREKNKSGVKTIKYYVEAIRERHEGKEQTFKIPYKRNDIDWNKVEKQLEDAQRGFKTGA